MFFKKFLKKKDNSKEKNKEKPADKYKVKEPLSKERLEIFAKKLSQTNMIATDDGIVSTEGQKIL